MMYDPILKLSNGLGMVMYSTDEHEIEKIDAFSAESETLSA